MERKDKVYTEYNWIEIGSSSNWRRALLFVIMQSPTPSACMVSAAKSIVASGVEEMECGKHMGRYC